MNDRSDPPRKPLLFLHIPKTAGTSFLATLRNLYGDARVLRLDGHGENIPAQIDDAVARRLGGLDCIAGHLPLHAFAGHLDRFRIFTILRHPVARVLSLYRFLRRAGPADLARMGLDETFSFEDFIRSRAPGLHNQISDGMTRLLCGDPRFDDPARTEYWTMERHPEALEGAMQMLRAHEFGLSEDMPATNARAAAVWGLPFGLDELRENTTERTGTEETLENIRRIVEMNILDITLYECAALLFRTRTGHSSAAPQPAPGAFAGMLLEAAPGGTYGMAEIPGRQGFHETEATGLAWLREDSTGRIHFRLAAPARVRLGLSLYHLTPGYPAERIAVALDGRAAGFTLARTEGPWIQLTTAPLDLAAGLHVLTLAAPEFIPVRQLDPGSPDRRALSVAVGQLTILPA